MKKNKTKFSVLAMLLALSGVVLSVCVGTVIPVVASILQVYESGGFVVEDGGHTYKCYTLKDDQGHPVDGVAIAWAEAPENTPDDSLTVPGTVSFNETEYTVRAIAKHGFRYCDFQNIVLPNTIEKIEPEAFAYCTKLKTFSMPYLVDEIATSTFLDCRNLETVRWTNENGSPAFTNDRITAINDHAFDSCVSLQDFYCPKSCTYFGEACFKNCKKLVNFYFPSAKYDEHDNITNYITVRPYALADCTSLIFIYFETNMSEIDNHAFVDCHTSLRIKYTGTSIPSYARETVNQARWRHRYIASNNNDKIPIDIDHSVIYSDETYPCLRYAKEKKVVLLDSAQDRRPTVEIINQTELDSEGEYAVIYKFDTPREEVAGCFDPSTGALTIPDTINGLTVKIIKESAFANNESIKSVKFNENLVQICNKAFYNSTQIKELDFTDCKKLKEVSYFVFHDTNGNMKNEELTSLMLPDCLEYIGGWSFCKFVNVNEFKLPAKVKAIDDCAFYQLGANITEAAVNLVLPKSLNDKSAEEANFKHITKGSYPHTDYTRFYAIGKYAFNEAKCLLTVTMEDDPDHETDNDYSCSFYSNVFHTASNLIRFKASKNLKFLGKDAFKFCSSLREVFLTTAKSDASGLQYPWCIDEEDGSYGGTLFFGSSPDLVCFLDGDAPGDLESYTRDTEAANLQINSLWNAETEPAYTNQFRPDSMNGRSVVPTYYGVDFNSIKYWDPHNKVFKSQPTQLSEYNAGVMSLVKNSSNKYIAVRYYYSSTLNTGWDYIDLTAITGISDNTTHDLVKIGDECFGVSSTLSDKNDNRLKQPGLYFVLPYTITEIGERAFFRTTNGGSEQAKNNGRYGARIITYKDSSGNYYAENGSTCTESQLKTTITNLEKAVDVNKRGYCILPSGITKIGSAAFYNNIFKTIRLPSTLTYIGVAAFYVNPIDSNNTRAVTTAMYMTDNDNFHLATNGGLYYIGTTNKKVLISQVNGGTGTLTIESHTNAIGMQGCANTNYTTINLPTDTENGLTTIYGGGFSKNRKLETVNNVSTLRYISNMENVMGVDKGWSDDGYEEVWDNSMSEHIANTDYRDYAYEPRAQLESLPGAFYDCTKLATFNFTQMTQIRKIGQSAFQNCSSLNNMTGGTNYTYKELTVNSDNSFSYTTISHPDGNSKNVLDLSGCSYLHSISKNAFAGCSKIKFIHLPDTKTALDTESALYISYDPETDNYDPDKEKRSIISDNASIIVLVGETALYAHHDFGVAHNAKQHYNANCFGSGNSVYYYVGEYADIPTADSSSIKYWTKSGNDFILIKNAEDARKYFGH